MVRATRRRHPTARASGRGRIQIHCVPSLTRSRGSKQPSARLSMSDVLRLLRSTCTTRPTSPIEVSRGQEAREAALTRFFNRPQAGEPATSRPRSLPQSHDSRFWSVPARRCGVYEHLRRDSELSIPGPYQLRRSCAAHRLRCQQEALNVVAKGPYSAPIADMWSVNPCLLLLGGRV